MAIPTSFSPGLFETVNLVIARYMAEVHTVMPGKVVAYDIATQTATIQPALKRSIGGQVLSLPQLLKVPVVFPATAATWLRLPVAAGDHVMIHCAEGSLDSWWLTGNEANPQIPAKFSLADAIATPGLHALPQAIIPKGADTSVELVNGSAWIEITALGKFKLTNGAVELLTVLDSILGHLIALTTIPAVVGTPLTLDPTVIAELTVDQINLDLLKA